MNNRVLLIITLNDSANIVYFLIDPDDFNIAVAEGKLYDAQNTLSYAFLSGYFRILNLSIKNNRTQMFTECLELLDYSRLNNIQFVTEQVIRLPDEWASKLYAQPK